jgi:hypothetical protein
MSKFDLRSVIRQEIVQSLSKRGDQSSHDEIARLQQSKSLAAAFGFTGPGFKSSQSNSQPQGQTSQGPGLTKGFLGPGFKK